MKKIVITRSALEEYNEMVHIIEELRSLKDDIEDEYLIDELEYVIGKAQKRMDELEDKAKEECYLEQRTQSKEYWDSQF